MNSVESLVAQIQGLSGNIGELTQLRNYLKQSDDLLRTESTRLAPLLTELDPSIHSLGYLYILEACTSTPISKDQSNELVLSVARFINVCSTEQIRLAPDRFVSICRRLKEQVMLLEDPMRGVAPLLTAIRKLQLSTEQLTTLHPDFLLLCLLSKCYKPGLSVLEDDVFEVEQPRDLFLYCYYGGMICIGQKQFRKALELLHNVVTAPMPIISAIAVEAYKKYILVSLIHLGQFATSFPKYTSSAAQRNLKNFSPPYLELVNSYSTGRVSELENCVLANRDKFESDKNLGLVKQVVSSMYKRNIQRLTQTYLTLSLQDIANTVQLNSPKEAEMHVLQMIQEGDIYATINQKDGMVRFLEDPEQYKTCEMIEHLDFSIQRIMMLSKKLTNMNEIMSCDSSYLGKVGRERQRFDFDDFDTVPSKFNI
ncbi:Proteasome component domain protein [Perilla frutescens var. hirtella]|nr:Proteasome component domain protein [Perilla frutescens var. frutescens]KAH6781797.1 Proteasome component domain protein [Perilla frutescens var. frutescens]KAH6800952.1 Proteasome component domain protein [Perilla frutescens var. hirtella]